MAFFGTPNAFIGIDIGTSALKIVELINRRKRIEIATYAHADVENLLVHDGLKSDEHRAIRKTAEIISNMMDKASASSDAVIAALPSSVVFSSVLTLPQIPESEMEKAVQFAARDIVPADLDDMVLGWSRIGEKPHMAINTKNTETKKQEENEKEKQPQQKDSPVPVFITAAPRDIVDRYIKVMEILRVNLVALEVETFPLSRSLLHGPVPSGLIVDMGDLATTFHIIDIGTPRVSHTIDHGGKAVTESIARAMDMSFDKAEHAKMQYGLSDQTPGKQRVATELALRQQTDQAALLLEMYQRNKGRAIPQSVLIGGGARMKGIETYWQHAMNHKTIIGNPWKGLAYPQELEQRLHALGLTYGVAVGLAMRGFAS